MALAERVAVRLRLERHITIGERAEIEGIVHESVLTMTGVFGGRHLEDERALAALVAYELLFNTADGGYRFEHEIVAGYLVRDELARAWRAHVGLLTDRTLDEAWVLAAPSVASVDRDAFFDKLFEVDPVLAAEAALERADAIPHVQTLLGRHEAMEVARATPFRIWQLYSAMAVLATPACLDHMRAIAGGASNAIRTNHAKRALSWAGDAETLARVLAEADIMSSAPFVVSGGAIAWWEVAPAEVALSLARERLDTGESNQAGASLSTLAQYGDGSDEGRVLGVIENTSSIVMVARAYEAAEALGFLSARLAVRALADRTPVPERLHVVQLIGPSPEDATWIVAHLTGTAIDTTPDPSTGQLAVDLLCGARLSEEQASAVRAAYDGANTRVRDLLWQVAGNHGLSAFESLAVDAFDGNEGASVGQAANFAAKHSWQDLRKKEAFRKAALAAVEDDRYAYGFHGWRLLAYFAAEGDHAVLASALDRQLRALLAAHAAASQGEVPSLMRGATNVLKATTPESAAREVESLVATILGEAPVVRDRLGSDLRLGLLALDLAMFTNGRARLALVDDLDPALVDKALLAISDPRIRTRAACLLVSGGEGDARIDIVAHGFERYADSPMMMSALVSAANTAWSDRLLQKILDSLGRAWSGGRRDRRCDPILERLMVRITRAQADTIVGPAREGAALELRELLQLWYDVARQRQ